MAETEGQAGSERVVFNDGPSPRELRIRRVLVGVAWAMAIASIFFPDNIHAGLLSSTAHLFLQVAPMFILIWAFSAFGWVGGVVTVDREGISGVAIAPKLNHLPWSRVRGYEIDGGAVVLDFEPADLLSEKPADRISKARVSLQRIKPEQIAAAIEKFWKPPQRA